MLLLLLLLDYNYLTVRFTQLLMNGFWSSFEIPKVCYEMDVTKTGNGKQGMGNREWGTGNGEQGMGNREWGVVNSSLGTSVHQ